MSLFFPRPTKAPQRRRGRKASGPAEVTLPPDNTQEDHDREGESDSQHPCEDETLSPRTTPQDPLIKEQGSSGENAKRPHLSVDRSQKTGSASKLPSGGGSSAQTTTQNQKKSPSLTENLHQGPSTPMQETVGEISSFSPVQEDPESHCAGDEEENHHQPQCPADRQSLETSDEESIQTHLTLDSQSPSLPDHTEPLPCQTNADNDPIKCTQYEVFGEQARGHVNTPDDMDCAPPIPTESPCYSGTHPTKIPEANASIHENPSAWLQTNLAEYLSQPTGTPEASQHACVPLPKEPTMSRADQDTSAPSLVPHTASSTSPGG